MAADIHQKIAAVDAAFDGEISLAAKDLRSGAAVLYHPDRKCATASVIKLPVLVHALLLEREGALSLCDRVTLRDVDKAQGSGILTFLSEGLRLSLRDACMLMIAVSDNTATNLVLDRVGIENVNKRMRALGCRDTRLFRKVFHSGPPVSAQNRRYGLGVTTPRDMLRLLTTIHSGKVGGPELSARVRRFLAAQLHREGIPRYLPAGCQYAGKSGAVDAVRNDVGFVTAGQDHDIALAVFCQKMPQPLWTPDNPGLLAIAALSRDLVAHFTA